MDLMKSDEAAEDAIEGEGSTVTHLVDPMDLMKSDEAAIEGEGSTDGTALAGERCELCSNVVIDRGLLGCCYDWFCFACIEKWGITENHCPMCKNEFLLITCIPVYDTTGNRIIQEHLFPRDEDLCIQGDNNILCFPPYHIDEDEVICLDDDGCKMRSGLASSEEDLTLDTAVACNSCNIWYHTFCVEFNPAFTNGMSWFCPRCVTSGVEHESEEALMQNIGQSALANATDPSFSQKVSMPSAAETAVVVSLVEGKQMITAAGNHCDLSANDDDPHCVEEKNEFRDDIDHKEEDEGERAFSSMYA